MAYLIFKILLTAVMIVGISELAKKSSLFAAILASLPLTSLLAMVWLYVETKETQNVVNLSYGIFWMVLPSLVFFGVFPLFLKWGWNFYGSLVLSIGIMSMVYWGYTRLLTHFGVSL